MASIRLRRQAALGVISVMTLSAGALAAGASARAAETSPVTIRAGVNEHFDATNAPGTVWFRSSPNWDYPTSGGFANGNSIGLYCYEFGGPAGPYRNTLWYYAIDNANGSKGWINDHYLDTPGTAANPSPQTGECAPSGFGTRYDNGPLFAVVNVQDWQYFDNSPNVSDNDSQSGYYLNGDVVQLYCYEFGGPAGPYGNVLWYLAYDQLRGGTYGWINDHYLDTPDSAARPVPQTSRHC
jgi:hypothetical protein